MALLVALTVLGLGVAFYARGATIMERELKERLRSTAAVAAMNFEGEKLASIHTKKDMTKPVYQEMVSQLNIIRNEIADIEYVYIMRRTEDPLVLEFVVDADAPIENGEIDENGNGVIDPEEELSYPGDLYDVSEVPAMQYEAFISSSVDEEVTYDQWGALISGYAPIRNNNGDVVAILGIDMTAHEYLLSTRSVFSGFSLLLFTMMAVLLAAVVVILTWRHRVDTLQEVDMERSALVGLALHQLGTPLSIFRWWVEILEEKYGDHICEETDACMQLEEGITRLQDVFNDLQEAHTVSRGNLLYEKEKASLRDIIHDEVEVASGKLARHKQATKVDIPEDIIMNLDRKLIEGVVQELLENAITYSSEKSTITISALRRKNNVVVSVRDQGCGISKEELPHVFKKFVRGDNAHKYRAVGNGLGLYVSKGIIEEAGGKIWVESKVDQGTTASFSLPISRSKKFWFF
jgi:signal transduction histidine kinase